MSDNFLKCIESGFKVLNPKDLLSALLNMYEDIYSCSFGNANKLLATYSIAKEMQKKGIDTGYILRAIEVQIESKRQTLEFVRWSDVISKFDKIKKS